MQLRKHRYKFKNQPSCCPIHSNVVLFRALLLLPAVCAHRINVTLFCENAGISFHFFVAMMSVSVTCLPTVLPVLVSVRAACSSGSVSHFQNRV